MSIDLRIAIRQSEVKLPLGHAKLSNSFVHKALAHGLAAVRA
jgi:hypothetical protein